MVHKCMYNIDAGKQSDVNATGDEVNSAITVVVKNSKRPLTTGIIITIIYP